MGARRWSPGEVVVRREVLPHHGVWIAVPVIVVADTDQHLVSYLAPGTRFGCPEGPWPIAGGRHPWEANGSWQGHGTLMVQEPGAAHAIWHFWGGPEREFVCWYVNLQDPFRRTEIGFDTSDHELDYLAHPDGSWEEKDRELMAVRVAEGRWTQAEADVILAEGDRLAARLDAGERWWDRSWRDWEPDPSWPVPDLADGWDRVPWR